MLIAFVCTGNICRSPMAEIVLRDRLSAAGYGDRVTVDSTGVSSEEHGNGIDARARKVLVAAGYSDDALRDHRARQVTSTDLETHDLILPMTAAHAQSLRRLAQRHKLPDAAAKIVMFRRFDPAAPTSQSVGDDRLLDIADPWYGNLSDFEDCLAQVEAAADGVVEWVRGLLSPVEPVP